MVDQNFINEVVQGVLNQLQSSPALSAPANVRVDEVFRLEDSVLTADIFEQKVPSGTTSIQVGSKSVITPSGHDYLRQNGIQWHRSETQSTKTTCSSWKVLTVQQNSNADSLWDKQQTTNDNSSSAQETISMICRGEAAGIIVLSEQPELVSCLANRNEQVRAAAVSNTLLRNDAALGSGLIRLQTSLKPNVYCLDASEFS